jgi:hypothetical protein
MTSEERKCSIGNGPIDADSSPQATKVLMILAVGLAGSWRLPVAYYLTNGTNADLQATILKSVISKLWEAGSLVVTVMMNLDVAHLFDETPHFQESVDVIDNHVSSLAR